jgi:hypothetical protein
MEREGVNVELAVLKRFMAWVPPDEVATTITPRRSKADPAPCD